MSDLEPAEVWAGLEDRAYRAWARTVKFYDNLKVVYQIQTTLREWQQQDEEQQAAPFRRLPNRRRTTASCPSRPIRTAGRHRSGGAGQLESPGGSR